ncbi:MAG TPA: glycosyltransferase family 4 protein [Kiritimatiellia bacterium]|nr:glycosyltransferase family 4 protein [Kiritimatiellia bacterium]HRZ12422.1 glycosyltransferase family 4 protein [Kiritimatiellia bacterium]HSA17820.1 glycosyltransferase family 4 protein [Kiritimatiellia bacterium]
MIRIGFITPASGPAEQKSVDRVWRRLEEALAAEFELVRYPGAAEGVAWRAFLDRVEAVVVPHPIRADRSGSLRKPFLHLALGTLPLGGLRFLRMLADLSNADSILISCRADQAIVERVFPRREIGASFLPFGVDLDVFRPLGEAAREAARAAHGLQAAAPVLVYAGRVTRPKNVHLLLDMVAALRPEFPGIRLVVAGGPEPLDSEADSYREELDARARDLGGAVVFAGPLDDTRLAELLSAADVFVTATVNRDENFGFAAVEAMACGLPVVGTEWGGLKDTVAPGETGVLMATRVADTDVRVDAPAGVAAIRRLLADPALRRNMAERALARAREHYGLDSFRRHTVRIVREAIDRAAGIGEAIPGTRFELHPLAMESLVYSQLGVQRDWYGRVPGFTPEDARLRRFFMEPYASGSEPR